MSKKHTFCGIECKFSDLPSIWKFFSLAEMSFGSYVFWTVDAAVYSKGFRMEIPSSFKSEYFQELVNKSFVAERLILHLYPNLTYPRDIDDYEDYLQSHCEMIILIYDCYCVEVYSKNHTWLEAIFQASQKMSDVTVGKKYEDTDTRIGMYV